MADVTLKSNAVTDLDADPLVKVNSQIAGGVLREAVGFVTTNSDDSIGSEYRICRVPSRARISEILGYSDIGSATAGIADVGVYLADGGAVKDADHFASAWDFSNADSQGVQLVNEAQAGNLVNEMEKQLWETLGETSDPNVEYDITLTLTEAVATAAAVVGLKVRYVLPE